MKSLIELLFLFLFRIFLYKKFAKTYISQIIDLNILGYYLSTSTFKYLVNYLYHIISINQHITKNLNKFNKTVIIKLCFQNYQIYIIHNPLIDNYFQQNIQFLQCQV